MRILQLIDKIVSLIVIMMLLSLVASAQTPPPAGGLAGAPLDGFSSILLVVGVGYGAAKLRKRKAE
jgi:hypothetical protein